MKADCTYGGKVRELTLLSSNGVLRSLGSLPDDAILLMDARLAVQPDTQIGHIMELVTERTGFIVVRVNPRKDDVRVGDAIDNLITNTNPGNSGVIYSIDAKLSPARTIHEIWQEFHRRNPGAR